MMHSKTLLYLTACLLLALTACREDRDLNTDTTSATDEAISRAYWDDLTRLVERESQQEGSLNGFHPSEATEPEDRCVAVNITPAGGGAFFPATLTLDFGAGCTYNGKTRSGVITAVFTGKYRNAGTVITVTPSNYVVNGHALSGTKTITNNGENAAGQLNYTIDIANGSITFPNGDVATRSSTRTRTWVAGQGTTFATDGMAGILDDEHTIDGTASGTNRNGVVYSAITTTPLHFAQACDWIQAGRLEITPDGAATRFIDYGNTGCDDQATVGVGNFSMAITLP